jgi:hypothetical protein
MAFMQTAERGPVSSFCSGLFQTRWAAALATFGVLLPIVAFCAVCVRFLSPLPVSDDYDAVLFYLVHLHALPTHLAQLGAVLFHQHNEYKPIWSNLVIALQYAVAGHVNFIVLSLLGDLQVFLLAWLFWKAFAPHEVKGTGRLVLFVPVALVIFGANYGETLNWPMPGLQNLGVVAFALLALWLLFRPGRLALVCSCIGLALAIAASGNGFFVYAAGACLLLLQRRWSAFAAWSATVALAAAVYFTHYAVRHPQPLVAHSSRLMLPVFILSFLGSFGGVNLPVVRYTSVLCGACIAAVVYLAVRRRYDNSNPAVSAFAIFLLITALGVSVTRGSQGYIQSLSSRYKIYSDLLLICCYAFGLHTMAQRSAKDRQRFYQAALAVAGIVFAVGTAYGIRNMHQRIVSLNKGRDMYYASGKTQGPTVPVLDGQQDRDDANAFNVHFREALREADEAGIYHMP